MVSSAEIVTSLRELLPFSPMTILVEDDLARLGDPSVDRSAFSYVTEGDRVLRWARLGGDGDYRILDEGSSRMPLIAWLCRGATEDFGLRRGDALSGDSAAALLDRVVAVAADAHDGEDCIVFTASRGTGAYTAG